MCRFIHGMWVPWGKRIKVEVVVKGLSVQIHSNNLTLGTLLVSYWHAFWYHRRLIKETYR